MSVLRPVISDKSVSCSSAPARLARLGSPTQSVSRKYPSKRSNGFPLNSTVLNEQISIVFNSSDLVTPGAAFHHNKVATDAIDSSTKIPAAATKTVSINSRLDAPRNSDTVGSAFFSSVNRISTIAMDAHPSMLKSVTVVLLNSRDTAGMAQSRNRDGFTNGK